VGEVEAAVTDVKRVRRTDPGNPEVCNIYTIHRAFSDNQVLLDVDKGCRTAGIGCIDCKKLLFKNLSAELAPIRERAFALMDDTDYVIDAIQKGSGVCSAIAKETMKEVRNALGLFL